MQHVGMDLSSKGSVSSARAKRSFRRRLIGFAFPRLNYLATSRSTPTTSRRSPTHWNLVAWEWALCTSFRPLPSSRCRTAGSALCAVLHSYISKLRCEPKYIPTPSVRTADDHNIPELLPTPCSRNITPSLLHKARLPPASIVKDSRHLPPNSTQREVWTQLRY